MGPQSWIVGDESAKEVLDRVFMERPFLLLPPLHRVPLRVGNVVELVGPSPSAKTQILIQAAISCILPKEWNGVQYGGLDHPVMFIDLDCRFDILRLSEMLKHRIMEATGSMKKRGGELKNAEKSISDRTRKPDIAFDEKLFIFCINRFLYVRCSNSFEFLATLKLLHHRLWKEKETHGNSVHLLMIDSIGAFHWVDRASTFLPLRDNDRCRKSLFLQGVSEAVVQEIKKLLRVHPMLIIATKSTILGDRYSSTSSEVKWNFMKHNFQDTSDTRNVTRNKLQLLHREYMPSVWQSFVTHRILVQPSDDHFATSNHQNHSLHVLEWLLPSLSFLDKFIVTDSGVSVVS
ncbi:DNA repair protein XRCC2-like [Quillaja saponaria]|uniref:DNA repair protein XRCC2-like n=1 Tax=Quillaja saponaria TaxID=32244 RepID=A0AAD7LAC6_QUISA|nr:DNA repair protein XRCC2-like [Quillaja saponaria]